MELRQAYWAQFQLHFDLHSVSVHITAIHDSTTSLRPVHLSLRPAYKAGTQLDFDPTVNTSLVEQFMKANLIDVSDMCNLPFLANSYKLTGTSFTSTNVKLRLRFDVHLTFHSHSSEPHLTS